ncbi:glycosyltransferase family 2 protein [Selenomonadales bacterium OttesenSCG-928-I06]|nr:glycosyltransferase family 2 protein [Selenomonadales bacterium OttesenSCG-928-I06]
MTISAVIIAKNEEKNIADCINSISFVTEIILVDDYSTDRTKEIAENMGAKVFQRALNGDWGAQQTFAINQATSDWVLFIDADERVTEDLAEEIKEAIDKDECFAYSIPFLNHSMGDRIRYGVLSSNYFARLFPKDKVYVEGLVHPVFHHPYEVKKLKSFMLHYTYNSWEQYLSKFNLYTKLAAQKNYNDGKRASFFYDIMLRPWFAFFKMFILKSGWRDGKPGFILCVFHYFYTMMKYVRLYYLQKEKQ